MSGRQSDDPLFVVVSGPPGSGKTTLGEALAAALGVPFLSKDAIKEALMGVGAVPDVESSRRFGRAAMTSLYEEAANAPAGAVLDANFERTLALPALGRLPGRVVEVFCRCPRELCLARYRARSPSRHPGHLDAARSDADLWTEESTTPVAGGWRVMEVETSRPVDLERLAEALAEARPGPAAMSHGASPPRLGR